HRANAGPGLGYGDIDRRELLGPLPQRRARYSLGRSLRRRTGPPGASGVPLKRSICGGGFGPPLVSGHWRLPVDRPKQQRWSPAGGPLLFWGAGGGLLSDQTYALDEIATTTPQALGLNRRRHS